MTRRYATVGDLKSVGILTCHGCFGPFAEVVALRVGGTFDNTQVARIDLCARCRLGVWTHWGSGRG